MADFKTGDVVRLKHGGLLMTVCGVSEEWVDCSWHKSDGAGHGGSYPPAALEHFDADVELAKERARYEQMVAGLQGQNHIANAGKKVS